MKRGWFCESERRMRSGGREREEAETGRESHSDLIWWLAIAGEDTLRIYIPQLELLGCLLNCLRQKSLIFGAQRFSMDEPQAGLVCNT